MQVQPVIRRVRFLLAAVQGKRAGVAVYDDSAYCSSSAPVLSADLGHTLPNTAYFLRRPECIGHRARPYRVSSWLDRYHALNPESGHTCAMDGEAALYYIFDVISCDYCPRIGNESVAMAKSGVSSR